MIYWLIQRNKHSNSKSLESKTYGAKYPHTVNTVEEVRLFPPVVQSAQGIAAVEELSVCFRVLPVCVCLPINGLKSEQEDNNFGNNWEPSQIPQSFMMHVHIKVPHGDSGEKW